MNDISILSMIDHTLLKAQATPAEIETLCQEALAYTFASVCVNSVYVPLAAKQLQGSPVKVCTVVGFPLGASLPAAKAYEAALAIDNGAQEVDMVLHVGALKAQDLQALHADISAVVRTCREKGNILCKVIFETALLTDEEKTLACQVSKDAGADFVKTSTGFGGGGATVEDVRLMRGAVGAQMGVKASGGIRSLADAQAMIAAGANRLGTSAGVAIARALNGEADAPQGSGY